MPKSDKTSKNLLYYWDSCVFLAWIQDEKSRTPEEKAGLYDVVSKIHKNEARLITSAMTHGEILKGSLNADAIQKLEGIYKRKNFSIIQTDNRIWKMVHDIRDYYYKRGDGLPTITTPDAVHLASAILYEADEFHTFDEKDKPKRRGLIPLNGNVAGYNLVIKKPGFAQQSLGLT